MKEKSVLVRFLRECCIFPLEDARSDNIRSILAEHQKFDWDSLPIVAAEQRVIPQLFMNLSNLKASDKIPVPSQVLALLKILYSKKVADNLMLFELLSKTLGRFAETGIQTVLIKGAAATAYGYPFPNVREMLDVDLFLYREDSLEPARRILLELGLIAGKVSHYQFDESRPGFKFDFLNADGTLGIDLHLAIGEGGLSYISGAESLGKPNRTRIGSTEALVTSPEDTLLVICTNSLGNGRFILRDLVDTITVLNHTQINWPDLLARAGSLGMLYPLYSLLKLSSQVSDRIAIEGVLTKLSSAIPKRFEGRILDGAEFDKSILSMPLRLYRDNYYLPPRVGYIYPVRRYTSRVKETIQHHLESGNGFESLLDYAIQKNKDMIKRAARILASH